MVVPHSYKIILEIIHRAITLKNDRKHRVVGSMNETILALDIGIYVENSGDSTKENF
jgi:hypothetical protein